MSRKRRVAGVVLLGAAAFLAAESLLPPHRQLSARACLGAIDVYQATGSRLAGAVGIRCRYTPSCSHYAQDAIAHFGTVGGVARTAGRLWRCSPWGGCGYDPAVEPPRVPQETRGDGKIRLETDDRERREDLKEAKKACGLAGAFCAVAIVISLLILGVQVLILVWVYKDAKARGDQNAAIWLVLVFVTHFVGLIVYLLARPKGDLSPCGICHNRKMTTLVKCPHCGRESGAGGAAAT